MPHRLPARLVGAVLLLVVHLTLSGCASAPPLPAPSSAQPPIELPARIASGRPLDLATGNHRAYWIWHDGDGVWHVRTTARRVGHAFRGMIRPLAGAEIVGLTPVHLDPQDRLGLVGRAISFDWGTRRRIDGFDFRLQGSAGLEFDLRLDGDASSRYIYLGRDKARPESAHFILVP